MSTIILEDVKMNKKGDVPTILIFLVAVILSMMALYSFVSFNSDFSNQSVDLVSLTSDIELAEKYVQFKAESISNRVIDSETEDIKLKFQEIAKNENIGYEGSGNFFVKIEEGAFSFEKKSAETYHLSVKGVFIELQIGENVIRRNFDIEEDISA